MSWSKTGRVIMLKFNVPILMHLSSGFFKNISLFKRYLSKQNFFGGIKILWLKKKSVQHLKCYRTNVYINLFA